MQFKLQIVAVAVTLVAAYASPAPAPAPQDGCTLARRACSLATAPGQSLFAARSSTCTGPSRSTSRGIKSDPDSLTRCDDAGDSRQSRVIALVLPKAFEVRRKFDSLPSSESRIVKDVNACHTFRQMEKTCSVRESSWYPPHRDSRNSTGDLAELVELHNSILDGERLVKLRNFQMKRVKRRRCVKIVKQLSGVDNSASKPDLDGKSSLRSRRVELLEDFRQRSVRAVVHFIAKLVTRLEYSEASSDVRTLGLAIVQMPKEDEVKVGGQDADAAEKCPAL
ncbi:hypothetical protein EXIGLDRAFT_691544 [Exidia glandulosa HHB12029]|uniref:Uncharacterized protein n=1 Tax=Exidia glandulosa HHB12029 TaxID=1314781 RepID=A0A166MRE9_EXIGL|nr:hypothetical protein EXIGLDRAFT_691544 [Exidia glandulosa HHB12029]